MKSRNFVLILIGLQTLSSGANRGPGEEKPPREKQKLIEIAPETTYVTEPLDEFGFVDYPGYLNRRMSGGVTPENNAAVLYWQAIGPDGDDVTQEFREKLVEFLRIDVFSKPGPFITTLAQFTEQKRESGLDIAYENMVDIYGEAAAGTWKSGDYPLMEEWIRQNEEPLRLVIEGSRRAGYYSPVILNQNELLLSTPLPNVRYYRSFARLLAVRAMLSLGEGRIQDAKEDLLAIHRLARHVGMGYSMIERLVAITLDEIAINGDGELALHGGLSSQELMSLRKFLSAQVISFDIGDSFNTGNRLHLLDVAQFLARAAFNKDESLLKKNFGEDALLASEWIWNSSVNWNATFRAINKSYDAGTAAAGFDGYRERTAALKKFSESIQSTRRKLLVPLDANQPSLDNADSRAAHLSKLIIVLLTGDVTRSVNNQNVHRTKQRNLLTALAILAYQANNGKLPSKLEDLVPDYCETVPLDLYTDAPLTYRVRGNEFILYSWGANLKDDGGIHIYPGNYENGDQRFLSPNWFDEEFFEE